MYINNQAKQYELIIMILKIGRMNIKGAGGVPDLRMVKIEFYVVCDRGQPQLPDVFTE